MAIKIGPLACATAMALVVLGPSGPARAEIRTALPRASSVDVGRLSGLTTDDLFNGDRLHDIWIHMNSRDWAQLRSTFLDDTYYPCDFEWQGIKAYNAGCRSRGSYTRNGVKPGLRVEFDHYVAGQTFLGVRSLVLRNFWQDPSMMKERIAMQVLQRAGVPASREAHARLFIGGSRMYWGVYAVVEDLNEQFLVRYWGRGDGYLYEYRWLGPYGFEDLGGDLEPYAARFEPKTHRTDSIFDLYHPIRMLIAAINASDSIDVAAIVSPYLDLEMFLTQAAVDNFLSNWDGLLGTWGVNNIYLYRSAESGRATFLPWDQDNTFIWLEMPPWQNVEANVLMRKAWESPALRAFYLQQLARVAAMSPWMLEEIDREASQIYAAAAADPMKNSTTTQFEEAIAQLKEFVQQRPQIISGYLTSIESASVSGRRPQ